MAVLFFWFVVLIITGALSILFNVFALSPVVMILSIIGLLLSAFMITFVLTILLLWLYGFRFNDENPKDLRKQRFINGILRLALHVMRTKIIITGENHIPKTGKPFVFMSNHQEIYDIIAIKPALAPHPLTFIAKEAAFKWPIIGRWLRIAGHVPISKMADRSAAESIIKGINHIKNGVPMAIFPEGQRSYKNELLPFKAGAFKLASKPKADILVATLYDFCKVFKGWPLKRRRIYIHFHPIITYDTYQTMKTQAISNHVYTMIQAQLERFKEKLA